MSDYLPTIGLEIHAELSTATKMFCNSKNDTGEKHPNVNICPVCMGHPGTLPVINREAVRQVLRVGVALEGKLGSYTEFDRKNYFYPDIPKGYQTSQYKYPLVSGGELAGIRLTRIHLEEDTARSTHDKGDESLIDFNRAGVPLMELVTEPVIHDAETAVSFAKELQLLLWYLKSSAANMEKGEMRVEANVSVSPSTKLGVNSLGTKVEVKNLNSFKAVEKAIRYEVERQTATLERGESVVQETRGWDENKEMTFSQRAKEESHDYRYFPDPDLPKFFISEIKEFNYEKLKRTLPELPWEKRERYLKDLGLTEEVAELYTRDAERSQAIDDIAKLTSNKEEVKLASNYIATDFATSQIAPDSILEIMRMIIEETISSTSAKIILKELENENGNPREIAKQKQLIQKSNIKELEIIAEKIIKENSKAVDEYKSGKLSSLQFLIGQAMKESNGGANPKILKEVFEKLLY
ncbi:MAG: Asp-tRNA(Asn)/Glu-tRNA(Gln) amidotransferase subunit GatB [Patescibacteria group bacterium]